MMKSHLKLFLMVAVLWLFYAVGKLFHLSSLLIILVFGLILNNHRLFFKGFLARLRRKKATDRTLKDLRLVTVESAFVVRTFFFVIFGITIPVSSLVDLEVAFISFLIVLIIYLVRFLTLKIFRRKGSFPELFIAPRGLITILLFYAIPQEFRTDAFSKGILLYPILVSSIIMAIALVRSGNKIEAVPGMTVMGENYTAPVGADELAPDPHEQGSEQNKGSSSTK
jgi:NhaP-type Na+/H+ or K+/H+ antiporter